MTSQTPPFRDTPAHQIPNMGLHAGFALITAGVLLAPFLINTMHAVPVTDDFCYAAQYTKSGFIGSIEHYYKNVNGRFFATFLILSLGRIFPIEQVYAAIPLVFFTSFALACVALVGSLVRILAPRRMDWRGISALGLLSALVLITNAEKLSEVFFWLPASATYTSAASGALVALACMLMLTQSDTGHSLRLVITMLGAFAAFSSVGSFESSGPVVMVGGVFSILIAYILKRPGVMGVVVIAAAAALGLWMNLSSLGTATRAGVLNLDTGKSLLDLIEVAARTFFWTSGHLGLWASRASVWFLAFAFFWAFRGQMLVEWKKDKRRRHVCLAVFVGLAVLPYLAALPMFYAYSYANPVRAVFFVDIFCMIFWLAVLSFAFANFGKFFALDLSKIDQRLASSGLFVACFLAIAGTGNFYNASLDIARGGVYAQQAKEQIRDARDHPRRTSEVVLVRKVTAIAPTLFVSDIAADPRRWSNLCFSEYLSITGVRVDPRGDLRPRPMPRKWRAIEPKGWVDPDPQAIGRPRPDWSPE